MSTINNCIFFISCQVVDDEEDNAHSSSSAANYKISNLPWVEKYRPKCLEDLIAHDEIRNILNKLIDSNKLPHLLFHGPPGTG